MLSKKKLFETLDDIHGTKSFVDAGLDHPIIGNETYGKKSMIYIAHDSMVERNQIESDLIAFGFKVSPRYNRPTTNEYNGPTSSEVQVSYFKGWHWDE